LAVAGMQHTHRLREGSLLESASNDPLVDGFLNRGLIEIRA
jgi:hypothetical protein